MRDGRLPWESYWRAGELQHLAAAKPADADAKQQRYYRGKRGPRPLPTLARYGRSPPRRGKQPPRQRFGKPWVESVAQQPVLPADLLDARGQRRLAGKRFPDLTSPLRCQLAIGVGVELVFAGRQHRVHLTTLSGVGVSIAIRLSFSRARLKRDITVPMGTSWTRAISS